MPLFINYLLALVEYDILIIKLLIVIVNVNIILFYFIIAKNDNVNYIVSKYGDKDE